MIWLCLKWGRGDLNSAIWDTPGLRSHADGSWVAGSTRNSNGYRERKIINACAQKTSSRKAQQAEAELWSMKGMVTAWMHAEKSWPLSTMLRGLDSIQEGTGYQQYFKLWGTWSDLFFRRFLWHLEGEWSSKRQEQNPRYDAITHWLAVELEKEG